MRLILPFFVVLASTGCNLFEGTTPAGFDDDVSVLESDTGGAWDLSSNNQVSGDTDIVTDVGQDTASPPADMNPIDLGIDAATTMDGGQGDRDNDGVPDGADNCPDNANPSQADADSDTLGDACDPLYDCLDICDLVCDAPDQPECMLDCAGPDVCDWQCSTGDCKIECKGSSACNGDCPGGGCEMVCRGQANCLFTCDGGNCDFLCVSGNCTTTCTGGGCSGG